MTWRDLQISKLAQVFNATVTHRYIPGGQEIYVDAPAGRVWKSSRCHRLYELFSAADGDSSMSASVQKIVDQMQHGLDICPEIYCPVCEHTRKDKVTK